MNVPRELQTERLVLRPFRDADLDAYAEIKADPEVMRFLGGKPYDRAETWRHMAVTLGHWALRGYGVWALEEKVSGALVGRAGLNDYEGWPGLEVAWTLGRPYWGRGFATEAARAALEQAFTTLGRDSVISLIDAENTASIRVAERLGAVREGPQPLLGTIVQRYRIDRAAYRTTRNSSRGRT